MEAMGKVKELFPKLSEISSGEIAALFARLDERSRDYATFGARRPWVAGYRITPRIIDPKSIGSQRGGRPPVMTQEL